MNYVVFESGGKQYKVQKGDTLEVEKVKNDGKSVIFDKVLLQVEDGKVTIGTPYISGLTVKADIKGEKKGEKIDVMRFHAKSRHRRHIGFRHALTTVEIKDFATQKSSAREKKV